MSGLAAVLAGRTAAGVYRWHAAFEIADVRHAVETAGWQFAAIDGWLAQTKSEFLTEVGTALRFPAYYGHNLDALVDCLRESPSPGVPGLVLLWDGWSVLARAERDSFDSLLSIFTDRAVGPTPARFVVLLRGEGPASPGVRSLD
ncbi:MAG: barstar family protein [Nocardioides sp.]